MVPSLPLVLLAAGSPLFVWSALRDQIVMPRLAATAWLTGASLIALSAVGAWQRVDWRRCRWPLGLLGAGVAVAAITTAFGADPLRSLLGQDLRYQGLLPIVMYALLMLAALAATTHYGTARPLLVGVFAGGALAAAYGLLQRLHLDWVHWTGLPPGRVGGAFAQPDVLGIELVCAAACATCLWPAAGARLRAVILAGVGLMVVVLLLTLSRGAWVGGAIAGAVLLAFYAPRFHRDRIVLYGAVAAVIVAAAAVALPSGRAVIERAISTSNFGDKSITQRVGLWRTSLDMAADSPILGAGPDAFPVLFPAFRTIDQPGIGTANVRPESSHDVFLDVLVDRGVVGLAVFLGLIAACVWMAVRALPALDEGGRAAIIGMLVALAGYFGATFFSFSEAMTGWIPWLLMGAIVGTASSVAGDDGEPVTGRALPFVQFGAAAAGIVLIILAGMAIIGDLYDGRAERSLQAGDFVGAVQEARTATHWDPLRPEYLLDLGGAEETAATVDPAGHAQKAVDAFHLLNSRFEPTAFSLIAEAQADARLSFASPADRERVFALLERAVRADPNNADVRHGVAEFYLSVGEDGRAQPHQDWLRAVGLPPAEPPPGG